MNKIHKTKEGINNLKNCLNTDNSLDKETRECIQQAQDLRGKKAKLENEIVEKAQTVELRKRELQSISSQRIVEKHKLIKMKYKAVKLQVELNQLIEKKDLKETQILKTEIQSLKEKCERDRFLLKSAQNYSDLLKFAIIFIFMLVGHIFIFKDLALSLWNERQI